MGSGFEDFAYFCFQPLVLSQTCAYIFIYNDHLNGKCIINARVSVILVISEIHNNSHLGAMVI